MSIREKLFKTKAKMQDKIKKSGLTEQERAEKLRRKRNKIKAMKPGAHRAISEGLMLRSGVKEVMRKEYNRRKYERQIKYQKKQK